VFSQLGNSWLVEMLFMKHCNLWSTETKFCEKQKTGKERGIGQEIAIPELTFGIPLFSQIQISQTDIDLKKNERERSKR